MRHPSRRAVVLAAVSAALSATLAHAGGALIFENTTLTPGQFGWDNSGIGDVNKDGVDDYAVGARGAAHVTVFSGANRSLLYEFGGLGLFGYSIAPYADVDADGRMDFLVGAPTVPGPSAVPGTVRVCSGLDGSAIRTLTGLSASERFGTAVASVGDVNGDAVPDIAVGAPGGTGISAGILRVYSGADGSEIVALQRSGATFRDNLGASVVGMGDTNRDGVPDFAVAAPGADPTGQNVATYGRVFIVSGKDGTTLRTLNGSAKFGNFGGEIATCGDQDGDGVTDLLIGARGVSGARGQVSIWSGRKGKKLFSLSGITPKGFFGIGVAGLDDIDGDGRPEIAIGAEIGGSGEVVVLSPRNHKLYFHHRGAPTDLVGDFISRAGDLNGDGKTELLIGAWGVDKARVFSIDATPVPLPAKLSLIAKLVLPPPATGKTKGTAKFSVKGSIITATISATALPVDAGQTYVAYLENGVGTGVYFSVGTLTVTPNGRGTILLTAQYLPPPELQVTTISELSGRRAELRTGATVVLAGTIP